MSSRAAATLSSFSGHRRLRDVLLGGFFAGLADFIYPTVKTVIDGGSWMRPWKGVASGVLGDAAREGGVEMVLIGVALHFFICFVAAALLYQIAKRVHWPPKRWILLGVLYGIAFFAVMNYVILPLSAIGRSIYPLEDIHVHAFTHVLVVGWPTAFFVARALRRPSG